MNATTAPHYAAGDLVRFREDFGAVGASRLVFEVETTASTDAASGRPFIGLKIRRNGRWLHRLAYLSDLAAA